MKTIIRPSLDSVIQLMTHKIINNLWDFNLPEYLIT